MNNGLNKKSKHKIPILQLNFYVCVAARSDLEAFNVPMRMMLQMPNEKLEEFQIYLEIFIWGEIVEKHNSDESPHLLLKRDCCWGSLFIDFWTLQLLIFIILKLRRVFIM